MLDAGPEEDPGWRLPVLAGIWCGLWVTFLVILWCR